MKKHLIIIPGIGDRTRWLWLVRPLWSLFGFRVSVFVFGWNDRKASYKESLDCFINFIDQQADNLYLIGISAGGTTVINALHQRPSKIHKVATVCSPYTALPNLTHHLLVPAIAAVEKQLPNLDKSKILSVYALDDPTVPITSSQPTGIKHQQIASRGHGLSIFLALTIFNRPIRRFFAD